MEVGWRWCQTKALYVGSWKVGLIAQSNKGTQAADKDPGSPGQDTCSSPRKKQMAHWKPDAEAWISDGGRPATKEDWSGSSSEYAWYACPRTTGDLIGPRSL